jgi:hypothetical protein
MCLNYSFLTNHYNLFLLDFQGMSMIPKNFANQTSILQPNMVDFLIQKKVLIMVLHPIYLETKGSCSFSSWWFPIGKGMIK